MLATGFKKFVQKGIALDVNVMARVDATLDVGESTAQIEVMANAPAVNTGSTQIGHTVENVKITTLPIVGRRTYTLMQQTPGVDSTANSIVLGNPGQRIIIDSSVAES